MGIALQEVASVLTTSVKKRFKLTSKSNGPFIKKLIYDNLLTEWYYIITYCGLYPKLTELCHTWSPDLVIAHQGFVNRDRTVKENYLALIQKLLHHPYAKWSTYCKANLFPQLQKCYLQFDSTDKASINVLFLMMYAAETAESIETDSTVGDSMFHLGSLVNPKSENRDYKLNNILFKKDDDNEVTLMEHISDLNLRDSAHKIINVSTMGQGLFIITNSGQKDDATYKAKWDILNQWQSNHPGTPLLSVSSSSQPIPSPTASKQTTKHASRPKKSKQVTANNNATDDDDDVDRNLKTPSPLTTKRKKSNHAKIDNKATSGQQIDNKATDEHQFDFGLFATCFEQFTQHLKDNGEPTLPLVEQALLGFLNDKADTTFDDYSTAISIYTPVKETVAKASTPTWDKPTLLVALQMFGSQNGPKSMRVKNKEISNDTFTLLGRGGKDDGSLPDKDFVHCTSIYAASAWENYHGNPKETSKETLNLTELIKTASDHGWVASITAKGSRLPDDGDLIFCTQDAFDHLIQDKAFLLDDFAVSVKGKDLTGEKEDNESNDDDSETKTAIAESPRNKKRTSEPTTAGDDNNTDDDEHDAQPSKKHKKMEVANKCSPERKKLPRKASTPKSQGEPDPPSSRTRSSPGAKSSPNRRRGATD